MGIKIDKLLLLLLQQNCSLVEEEIHLTNGHLRVVILILLDLHFHCVIDIEIKIKNYFNCLKKHLSF